MFGRLGLKDYGPSTLRWKKIGSLPCNPRKGKEGIKFFHLATLYLVSSVAHAVVEAVPAGGVALGLVVRHGSAAHDVARLRRTRALQESVARTEAAARRGAVVALAAAWILVVEGRGCAFNDD